MIFSNIKDIKMKKIYILSLIVFIVSVIFLNCNDSDDSVPIGYIPPIEEILKNMTTTSSQPLTRKAKLEITEGPQSHEVLTENTVTFKWNYLPPNYDSAVIKYRVALEPISDGYFDIGSATEYTFNNLLNIDYKFHLSVKDETNGLEIKLERVFSIGEDITNPDVLFLIAKNDINKLGEHFYEYLSDIETKNKILRTDCIDGGTCEDVRMHIQKYKDTLEGVIIIGKIPVGWFERTDPDYGYEVFPIDLYYMDLDGGWFDSDGDEIFDYYNGSYGPDIWLARIDQTPFYSYDDYFKKVMEYKKGNLKIGNQNALAYINKDWVYTVDQGYYKSVLEAVYGNNNVTVVEWPSTSANDYLNQLQIGYEYVHNMTHAAPHYLYFDDSTGSNYETIDYNDIVSAKPKVHFHNCFNCSGCRFTEDDAICLGYTYFSSDYGLGSVGSAKTGSMLFFEEYYTPLSQGKTFGEAYLEWFENNYDRDEYYGYPFDAEGWFFGMTYLGDPFLKPKISTMKRLVMDMKKTYIDHITLKKRMVEHHKRYGRDTTGDKERYENRYLKDKPIEINRLKFVQKN